MRALTHGRTNKKKKSKNSPFFDKFCYWTTDKSIVKRLNYTIKPNNTRDYGSQSALENKIRARVYNSKRTVPLLGPGNGGWKKNIKPDELQKMACRNRISKNGEAGQIIYWKSKLLVSQNSKPYKNKPKKFTYN